MEPFGLPTLVNNGPKFHGGLTARIKRVRNGLSPRRVGPLHFISEIPPVIGPIMRRGAPEPSPHRRAVVRLPSQVALSTIGKQWSAQIVSVLWRLSTAASS
jgi:hypothetical protein